MPAVSPGAASRTASATADPAFATVAADPTVAMQRPAGSAVTAITPDTARGAATGEPTSATGTPGTAPAEQPGVPAGSTVAAVPAGRADDGTAVAVPAGASCPRLAD